MTRKRVGLWLAMRRIRRKYYSDPTAGVVVASIMLAVSGLAAIGAIVSGLIFDMNTLALAFIATGVYQLVIGSALWKLFGGNLRAEDR